MQTYRVKLSGRERCISGRSVETEQATAVAQAEAMRPQVSETLREHIRGSVVCARDAELDRLGMLCVIYMKKKAQKLSDQCMVSDLQSRLTNHDRDSERLDLDAHDLEILREACAAADEKERVQLLPFAALLRQINSPEAAYDGGLKVVQAA